MAGIIASTHFAYPWRDGQAELAWVSLIRWRRVCHMSIVNRLAVKVVPVLVDRINGHAYDPMCRPSVCVSSVTYALCLNGTSRRKKTV